MPEGVRSAACGYPGARHTFCFGASSRAVASFDVQAVSFARGVGTMSRGGFAAAGGTNAEIAVAEKARFAFQADMPYICRTSDTRPRGR